MDKIKIDKLTGMKEILTNLTEEELIMVLPNWLKESISASGVWVFNVIENLVENDHLFERVSYYNPMFTNQLPDFLPPRS